MILENLVTAPTLVTIATTTSVVTYACFLLSSLSHLCFYVSVTFRSLGNVVFVWHEHLLP